MKKITMSVSDYETMLSILDDIPMEPIFYSIEDVQQYIEKDIDVSLPFALKLANQPIETEQEKQTRRYLVSFINTILDFSD